MTSILGVWDLTMKTPIGSIAAVYTFAESDGVLCGSAASRDETVELRSVVRQGATVTWQQSISRPMRLNLRFDVQVDDGTLTGYSRAGRLPRSPVTGTRRS